MSQLKCFTIWDVALPVSRRAGRWLFGGWLEVGSCPEVSACSSGPTSPPSHCSSQSLSFASSTASRAENSCIGIYCWHSMNTLVLDTLPLRKGIPSHVFSGF